MALTADEQALLNSLQAKATEPEAAPANPFDSVEKILHYVISTYDKFSANPDDRHLMLEFLDSVINPSSEPANAEAN